MTIQIAIVLLLTFVINLITTLSYSVRIVAVRTGRIAISFALFNILVLISRTANGFQAPLLAKTVENDIKNGVFENAGVFRLIILSCSVATVVGAILVPTFHRVLSNAVLSYSVHKSFPRILLHGLSKTGIEMFKEKITLPDTSHITKFKFDREFPWKIFILNIIASGIFTIGVLSAVYAAYLNPEFRSTAGNLSAIINGLATILMFLFIDPHLSVMTDDVTLGKCPESTFRKNIVYMIVARLVGTMLAQALFLPAARVISWVAEII
jgi:hypothetical protein